MSSLANAMKRQKTHRERHQPESRKNLGLLEKKKDYKLRAKDFNEKQEILKQLRKKALNKNPDEFYYHMINAKLEDGVHKEKSKEPKLSEEQVALMQTQDLKYILSRRTSERNKIEKLKAQLHLISAADRPANRHTIFVDSEKEKRNLDLAAYFETHPALLGRTSNRPRLADLKAGKFATSLDADTVKEASQRTSKAYKELEQRVEREAQLALLQRKMEIRSLLRGGKNKPERLIQEETKSTAPVYLWPKERKK